MRQGSRKLGVPNNGALLALLAMHAPPHRLGKMAIILPPRNDVPVQVRDDIAKTGQIDLVRGKQLPHHRFDSENNLHQIMSSVLRQIAHFTHVICPDHAAKARIERITDPNDATVPGLPEECSSGFDTEFAGCAGGFHVFALR